MKICLAQTKPVTGNIAANIERHKAILAAADEAEMVIFPELSLTGYEPSLAQELATTQDDPRLDTFQTIADAKQMTIGVGVPTKSDTGICISMVIFQPHQTRKTYSKKYLHADEEPFFVSGESFTGLLGRKNNVGLAICYEISVPEHASRVHQQGAEIYVASVAKFVNGVENAEERLSEIAAQYNMTVMMSNCIGLNDGGICAGNSGVWSGDQVDTLDDAREGIFIFDTESQEVVKKYF
ncbi:MAG: carbon-nitrogen hydrolase family protein [Ardenticatenaceae bacterium]|nr:carbon-nitrogen hydrolase family protein [Ardenticatenaceae bacterium]